MFNALSYRDFVEAYNVNPATEQNAKAINTQTQSQSIPVVYGLQRIVPPRVFVAQSNALTDSLVCVFALSEGPCLGVYRLFIDDTYVQTDQAMILVNDGSPDGTANTVTQPSTGSYAGIAQFEFMSGRELALGNESKLLKSHIFNPADRPVYDNELCYLVCVFRYFSEESPYNGVPKITVDLFGKQVAPANNPTSTIKTYSTNPADCLVDYLTNSVYGAGFSTSIIDTTSFGSARTYFAGNINVNTPDGQLKVTEKYTCNAVIDTARTIRENVQEFLKSYFCLMPYIQGKFKLIPEQPGTPEIDFTESAIVGNIRITYPEAGGRYNSVFYTYQDPENGFAITRGRFPSNTTDINALLVEDGNFLNNFSLTLNNVTDPYMAERIAKTYLNKSRQQIKFEFDIFKDAYKYQVGDLIRIKVSIPDIDFVEARITRMSLTSNDLVRIEAYSHADELYPPFTDFFQTKPNYTKPLIPSLGGIIIPSIPTQPIGVVPPTTGNPSSSDPGGIPEPTIPPPPPVPPTQPTEQEPAPPAPVLPAKPQAPVYDINISTNEPDKIGANEEFYVAAINTTYFSGTVTKATIDNRYTTNYGNQNTRSIFTSFGSGDTARGIYYTYPVLTYRNLGFEDDIYFVYELPNDRFGVLQKQRDTAQFDYYIWDPENPTPNPQYFSGVTGELNEQGTVLGNAAIKMTAKRFGDSFVHVAQDPLSFYTSGGTFYNSNSISESFFKGAVRHPTLFRSFNNFQDGTSVFALRLKFFYANKKYIGEYTYRIGPGAMTTRYLADSRAYYAFAVQPGTEVPF